MSISSPLISVILPFYKAEPFLESIFRDLQTQKFDEDEQEWIFIDDGGSESQAYALDALKERDSRVTVVHKTNGGVSSARNTGIEVAKGEWIVFADPDDRLKPDHLKRLYDSVSGHNNNSGVVDLGIGGYDQYFEGENRTIQLHLDMRLMDNQHVVSAKDCFLHLPEMLFVSVWGKIYRTAFLRENNIRFREDLSFNEDTCFNGDVFRHAQFVACLPDSGYTYIKYQNSTACSSFLSSLKQNNIQRIDSLCDLKRSFGEKTEVIDTCRQEQLCILAYMLACNPFKLNSDLSFSQCVKYLKSEIFDDIEMMQAVAQRNTNADNKVLRLCFWLIKTKSPWLLGVVFLMLYRMKYKMNGLFLWLKRQGVKN